ncbi:hypothetical protein [Arenimonas sp. MALMAid1274]|uniref:hypothetical protein n=1 Tax=Arenimonas sp. MALMAid1274 TaxID=3411630 RepID=UPI003B9FEBEA
MNTSANNPAGPDTPGARDLFAAHALAALIGGPKLAGVPRADPAGMARQAWEYADAMMRARAGG